MTEKDAANQILSEIAVLKEQIRAIEKVANEQMEEIVARQGTALKPLIEQLTLKDKEIKTLMKSKTVEVFDGADKVKLDSGVLLHAKEFKLSIPREALAKIEQQGWTEAVRIAKSVNRAVVEGWPEERLVVIGAKRKLVDQFGYELRG